VNCRVDRVQDLGHVQSPCKCTFDSCVMINQTSGFCFTILSVSNEKFGFWFGFLFSSRLRVPDTLRSFFPSRLCFLFEVSYLALLVFFFSFQPCNVRLSVPSSRGVYVFSPSCL
jgi:hypothetical protein